MSTGGDIIDVVIVTGLSGAGKTSASDWFEDHGYYCIDNMPPLLIQEFLDVAAYNGATAKAAFVVDVRSEEFFSDLKGVLETLRHRDRINLKILFIEASNAALLKRFSETRRTHPLAKGRTNAAVIDRERDLMADIRDMADYVVDTTNTKVADFYAEMDQIFLRDDGREKRRFTVNVQSFGFKYGVPIDTDMVMDVRFLPNPFYVNSLRKLTGNNKKVQHYVMKFEESQQFLVQLDQLLQLMIPHFVAQGKYHLNLAFGCTGGQHRSVVMANRMAETLKQEGYRVTLEHRELNRK